MNKDASEKLNYLYAISLDESNDEIDDEAAKRSKEEMNKMFDDEFKSSSKEYAVEYKAYDEFIKEFNKLYNRDKLIDITKIISLFNKYLFSENGKEIQILKNVSMFDYIKIAKKLFNFLNNNYLITYEFDKNEYVMKTKNAITKVEFETKINKVYEKVHNYKNIHIKDITNEDDLYQDFFDAPAYYYELRTDIIRYYSPFNEDYIRSLIKLEDIVSSNEPSENINKILLYKLLEYDMTDDLFEYLRNHHDIFTPEIINRIHDSKSAKIAYNLLNEKTIEMNNYKEDIDKYYYMIIDIISRSEDEYLKGIYKEFRHQNIKELSNIFDKIKLFRQLELSVFKDLGIKGTYGENYYGIFAGYEYEEIFSSLTKYYNKINYDDLPTYDDLEKEDSNNFDVDLNRKATINTEYEYDTSDEAIENKLRLMYQQAKNHFKEFDDNWISVYGAIFDFHDIKDIDTLLQEAKEIANEYEFQDIKEKLYAKSEKYENLEYNTEEAKKILERDLKSINRYKPKYLEIIDTYSKLRKTLLAAANLWNMFLNTQNMSIDKDGQDYTPYVAGYLKAVEIILYRKIRDKYQLLIKNNVELKQPYTATGKVINLLDNNDSDLTVGSMIKYIRRENKIINEGYSANELADKLEIWADEVRNSHFHKDIIESKNKAKEYKNRSLNIIIDIIEYI